MNKLLDNPDQLSQGRFYVKVKQGVDLYSGVLSADNPYFTKSKETIARELKAEQEGKTQAEKDQIKEKYETWEKAVQSVSVKNENILIAELMSREPVKVGTTDFYQIKDGDSNHCRVKKSDVEGEPFCQHDWRKMGFEIAEGSSDSHGYLTDKKTLKIFDELYEKIPREYQEFSGNYHTQKDFIDRVITNKKYEYYRRRIIGRHPTEWQGEDNSKFIKMLELLTRKKDEPEQLSIHLIGVIQKVLEDYPDIQRAKALFNHEEERIKKLSFWKDVPELATKQPYHINPIAFVGNLFEENITPPWLVLAWEEYYKYKGLKENEEPLLSATKKYFSETNMKDSSGINQPWCAALVYWLLKETGYDHDGSYTAYARTWNPNETKSWYGYWKQGEVHKPEYDNGKGKPFVGALALQGGANITHVGIVVGVNSNGNPILLGGNQSDELNLSSFRKRGIHYYVKPKGYIVPEKLEKLPILTITAGELSYDQTR